MIKSMLFSSAVVALAALSAVPAAAESRVALGYQNVSVDGAGDQDGLGLRYVGSYAGTVDTSIDVFSTDVDGTNLTTTYADVSYKYRGLIGPKLAFASIDVEGAGDVTATYAGIAVGTTAGNYTLNADVISDVDNFGDSYIYSADVAYDVSPKMTLTAEAGYEDAAESAYFELGAMYDVTDRVYVQGEITNTNVDGAPDLNAAFVGVGLKF